MRVARSRSLWCALALVALTGCPGRLRDGLGGGGGGASGTGVSTPVEATGLPSGHPPVAPAPTAASEERTGRARRRLSALQLHTALLSVTGQRWLGRRRVPAPDAPQGYRFVDDADMLRAVAPTLGEADYRVAVRESLDPTVPYAKLASDAARATCAAAVAAESAGAPAMGGDRRIFQRATPTATLAGERAAVDANIAALALSFWGRELSPSEPEFVGLVRVFETVSTAPRGGAE